MPALNDFFAACSAALGGEQIGRSSAGEDVTGFLRALGYLEADSGEPNGDERTRANRAALLGLASKFERVFQIPMPHAPGGSFFGGMVSPAAVGIGGHGDAPIGAGGRGETLAQAFESCMGEAAEYLSFVEWPDDPLLVRWAGDHCLSSEELAWSLAGIGLAPDADLATLDWVRARSLTGGREVLFPSELVLRRPEAMRSGTRQAESTGVAAAVSLDDAILSALLEVVERDAIALWWFGGEPAAALDPEIAGDGSFRAFLRAIRGGSARPHWFLDITTDLGVPAVAALSSDADGTAVVGGFAAHFTAEQAARRAFLEMCQMELAQQLSVMRRHELGAESLGEQDRVWIERLETLNVAAFGQLSVKNEGSDAKRSSVDECSESIAASLENAGYSAYYSNLTRPPLGIPVARVVISGLQSSRPDCISVRLRDTGRKNRKSLKNIEKIPSLI